MKYAAFYITEDLSSIIVTTADEDEIKAIPNNDKKTTEVAASLMFQKENIYMIPTEILQRVASGKMHFDSEYVEKAQEELEKRKGKNQ